MYVHGVILFSSTVVSIIAIRNIRCFRVKKYGTYNRILYRKCTTITSLYLLNELISNIILILSNTHVFILSLFI